MNKILNYLEDDNWYKIFDAENEEDIEYKLLEREKVQTLLKETERLNNDFTTLKLLQQKHLEEIERLNNVLDNIGYKIEGIIKNNERIGITKATGEIISKHDIELLKNILKMIDTQDISIRGDKE